MKFLYYVAKPLVNIFLRIYYKFDVTGLENVPRNKAIILAPNHSNAFIDPVLIGMTVKQDILFFARGDVFKGAISRWALKQLNIRPMYRIQEGYSEVKKNNQTFEECRQLLTADKTILMFPEGICIQERRLRPLKKGLARIAFYTAASTNFSKDILILPIGVNYSSPTKFRSKAVLDFGKPISILEYKQLYIEDPVKAINNFTKLLEEKMTPHLVIIKNPENEKLVAAIEEIYLEKWMLAKPMNTSVIANHYEASKEIANMINKLDLTEPQLIESLRVYTASYIEQLNLHLLRDHLLDEAIINNMNLGTFVIECIILYLGYPIYSVALLLNFVPYYIAQKYSDRKIKNIEFYVSIYANLAMVLWLVYYFIQLILVGVISQSWKLLGIYALLVPTLGYFAVYFYSVKQKILGRWRLLKLVRTDPDAVTRLLKERRVIISEIEHAKKAAGLC